MENGVDVYLWDDDGWMVLYVVVCGKKKKCVVLLFEVECDVFVENIDGLILF